MHKYIFTAIFTLYCSFCFAQDYMAQATPAVSGGTLAITIDSDNIDYSTQDKIKLTVTFINSGRKDLSVCTSFIKHRLLENIRLEDEDGVVYALCDRTLYRRPAITEDDYMVLGSGEIYEVDIEFEPVFPYEHPWYYKISYTQQKMSALPPGRYKLSVSFEDKAGEYEGFPRIWEGKILSNAITINILESAKITRGRALEIAEAECLDSGWGFNEPLITDKTDYWEVMTNKNTLGGNAYICIDKATGSVLAKYRLGP